MKNLLNWIKWNNTDQLLSIGCGSAWWEINLLFNQPCEKLILIDPNAELLNEDDLAETIQYFEKMYQKDLDIAIHFFNQDVKNVDLATNSLDGVLFFNALHEMEEKLDILKECKRIGKLGSFVFVEEELSFQDRLVHQGCGNSLFYENELILLFENAGFKLSGILKKDEVASYFLFLNE